MSFKIIQSGSALPVSWPVNPNAEFQPGMIAQLGSFGNNIVCGVSDGTAPIGIIDDIKTRAFSAPAIDEPVIAHVPEIAIRVLNGKYYTTIPIQQTLENSNILEGSIRSNPVDASVNLKNGVLIFPEGTELNLDLNGDGIPDAIRTVVSYSYQVPNIPGDDSTAGSGRVTVWFQRLIGQVDVYETRERYPINANLFVSECGLLTTRQISENHPGIAIVTGSPNAIHGSLEFLWI